MSRGSARRTPLLALVTATIAVLVWGALAFGGVYRWAYVPLAVASGVVGLVGLLRTRGGRPRVQALTVGLITIGLGIGLQLLPLPPAIGNRASPAGSEFLKQHSASYGVLQAADPSVAPASEPPPESFRPLSISPQHTFVGLGLFVSLALLFLGAARVMSVTGGLAIARPLIGFGIVLAVVGIGQYTLTLHELHPLIYGFWKPQFDARPFGPFVNPNHFAGWMLMVLPLALALFYERLHRTMEEASGQDRMALIGSPEFGGVISLGFISVVMGLSLMMTQSRSALAALAIGSLMALWVMLRRQRSLAGRAAVIVAFLAMLVGASAWAGLDTVAGKVSADVTNDSLGGRLGAWKDTLHIIRDFPLTGSGFNTFGTAMTIYQTGRRDLHFQEAHNDYLQIAAEGGLLLGIPVLLTVGIFVREILRRFREAPKEGTTYWLRVGAVTGLITIAAQSMVEFSLQMPGNAALFAVLAAMAIHQSPNLRAPVAVRRKTPSPSEPRSLRVLRHGPKDESVLLADQE